MNNVYMFATDKLMTEEISFPGMTVDQTIERFTSGPHAAPLTTPFDRKVLSVIKDEPLCIGICGYFDGQASFYYVQAMVFEVDGGWSLATFSTDFPSSGGWLAAPFDTSYMGDEFESSLVTRYPGTFIQLIRIVINQDVLLRYTYFDYQSGRWMERGQWLRARNTESILCTSCLILTLDCILMIVCVDHMFEDIINYTELLAIYSETSRDEGEFVASYNEHDSIPLVEEGGMEMSDVLTDEVPDLALDEAAPLQVVIGAR
ncbi:unnamed protein product [Leptidea sinapis]|uniref:Uncharacterized protein n=1 Tax=Leptidea sinapis TaxID=189913 RepID=A0A5E4QBP4_9NEOP|nr:unnamed protein product [Leptidea sinapis]